MRLNFFGVKAFLNIQLTFFFQRRKKMNGYHLSRHWQQRGAQRESGFAFTFNGLQTCFVWSLETSCHLSQPTCRRAWRPWCTTASNDVVCRAVHCCRTGSVTPSASVFPQYPEHSKYIVKHLRRCKPNRPHSIVPSHGLTLLEMLKDFTHCPDCWILLYCFKLQHHHKKHHHKK